MSKLSFDIEEFSAFETKVDRVMKILEDMKTKGEEEDPLNMEGYGFQSSDSLKSSLDNIHEDDFIVNVKENRSFINKKEEKKSTETENPNEMNKFTFMQQIEEDANKRAEIKREREKIAQNFRNLGNIAFREEEYEKAINMYSKAIDHVKDSPILYNNRALSYMKLKVYRRAIIDCDYVLNKLDEKNLRSWLYRATAFKRLRDEQNFESCIKWAKKINPKESEYIDKFVEKLENNEFCGLETK